MSSSFARFFRPFFNFHIPEHLSPEMDKLLGGVIGTISISVLIGHGVYAFTTAEHKIIKVTNKYQFNRDGLTEFMIIDENGNVVGTSSTAAKWGITQVILSRIGMASPGMGMLLTYLNI